MKFELEGFSIYSIHAGQESTSNIKRKKMNNDPQSAEPSKRIRLRFSLNKKFFNLHTF